MLARFLDNWPYKLLALAIAVVLRVYVGNTVNPQSTKKVTIPIFVRNIPDNLVATDYTPNVTLEFGGPPGLIDSIGPSDIGATVDVSKCHPGPNPALPILVAIAPGLRDQVQIENKSPNGASVYLDARSSIVMSVRADFSRTAPVGYEYQMPTVSPPVARVGGPESTLKQISRLVVFADSDNDPLTIPTTIDEPEQIIALNSRDTEIEGVTITPTQAHVIIPIQKVDAFKSLVISPQIIGSPKYPLRIGQVDVDPSMVVVSGPAPLLAQTSVVLTVPVDVSQQNGTFQQSVKLDLPDGLSPIRNPLVEVTVHLTAAPPNQPAQESPLAHQVRTGAIQ